MRCLWLLLALLLFSAPSFAQAPYGPDNGGNGLTNLYNTGASVGNGADTTEDTLQTFVVPAGQLANVGDRLIITVGGTFAASTDTKTARVRFNGVILGSIPGIAAGQTGWTGTVYFMKNGSSTQVSLAPFFATTTLNNLSNATGQTDTSTITITVTGQNATNSVANSITCRYMTVDFIP